MTELWLISAPGEKTCQHTWEAMNNVTAKQEKLSNNYKFHIPDLKVGTLDVLVGLSDELTKLDVFCESVARKVANYLGDVLEDSRDKLHENLLANGMDIFTYMTRFQWDMAKYPVKQSLKNISEIIAKQTTQIDNDLKTKAQNYNNLKGNLQAMERRQTHLPKRNIIDRVVKIIDCLERKFVIRDDVEEKDVSEGGSLLTRSLADLVKKEDFVLESEYLCTLIVVVPKASFRDWFNQYESLAEMVVPRSSKLIHEDNEHGLFSVSLFKKVVDEYKTHCREHKFVVRDFTYNEEELKAGKNELTKLETDKKKQFGPLVRWLKVNFSEAFTGWIHVKALRVFVESVLRYGLPVNFQGMLVKPSKGSSKRLRIVLNNHYSHLDNSGQSVAPGAEIVDIPGLNMNQSDYYPYVCYKLVLDFVG